MGLEWGALSLVSTTEELLDRKVAAPVQKTENTAVGIRHADQVAPSICKKLALTSLTSDGRSVGIVRSRIHATEILLTWVQRQRYESLWLRTRQSHGMYTRRNPREYKNRIENAATDKTRNTGWENRNAQMQSQSWIAQRGSRLVLAAFDQPLQHGPS
jgi:NAD dependent epimerase/dehydratase family enzyme